MKLLPANGDILAESLKSTVPWQHTLLPYIHGTQTHQFNNYTSDLWLVAMVILEDFLGTALGLFHLQQVTI